MSDTKSSGNLTKGDVISFIALLLMGVLVFFGMNFMTLGDRIPSIVVAILTVVLMTVFVFLAAYAKSQDRFQSTWKKVQYAMLTLYILGLIPCYIFTAKFFDIQLDKENVIKQVNADTDGLNSLFNDYNRLCESRVSAYQIALESMLTSSEGRARLASILDIQDSKSITAANVNQAVESFSQTLKGTKYRMLLADKDKLVKNCQENFNNWNILYVPVYAADLGAAGEKYTKELEQLYTSNGNEVEKNVPEFKPEYASSGSAILDTFKSVGHFSIAGLLATLILGLLGLVKYLLGKSSSVIPMKAGSRSVIDEDGGFTF